MNIVLGSKIDRDAAEVNAVHSDVAFAVIVNLNSCCTWVHRLREHALSQQLVRTSWQNGALVNFP